MCDISKILITDIEKICRTCLTHKSPETLCSLFENSLKKEVCKLAHIELECHSSLPHNICTQCINKLNLALDFQNQILESERQLKTIIYPPESTIIYNSFVELENGSYKNDYRDGDNEGLQNNYDKQKHYLVVEDIGVDRVYNEELNVITASETSETENIQSTTDEGNENNHIVDFSVGNKGETSTSETTCIFKNKPATFIKNPSIIDTSASNVIKWAESETIIMSNPNKLGSISENTNKNKDLNDLIKTPVNNHKILETCTIKPGEKDTIYDNQKKGVKTGFFKCKNCSRSFKYDSAYRAHCLRLHGIPLVCEVCNDNYNDLNMFISHIKLHKNYKPFVCPICGKKFSVISTLKKHHRLHDKIRNHECLVCGKKFFQRSNLMIHKRCHTGEKPHKCEFCEKPFADRHGLNAHLKIHRGEKKHECQECGVRFIHGFSLRVHLRKHSGEKPYVCKLCNNGFTTASYLKIHMRTHTAEKPYRCDLCPMAFISKCALSAHVRTHSGEKKFQCDTCGQRSSRWADLQTHMRIHSDEKPYTCDQCPKRYKTSSNLAAHKKTHLGLKDHLCNICSKAFGDRRTLKCHIRTHTGETPYLCNVCGKRYKQSGQLSTHKKIHTTADLKYPTKEDYKLT